MDALCRQFPLFTSLDAHRDLNRDRCGDSHPAASLELLQPAERAQRQHDREGFWDEHLNLGRKSQQSAGGTELDRHRSPIESPGPPIPGLAAQHLCFEPKDGDLDRSFVLGRACESGDRPRFVSLLPRACCTNPLRRSAKSLVARA